MSWHIPGLILMIIDIVIDSDIVLLKEIASLQHSLNLALTLLQPQKKQRMLSEKDKRHLLVKKEVYEKDF